MYIWRKTYGYNKKEDWIANSQFSEATGIPRPHVTRTLSALKKKMVVTSRGKKLSVNKEYKEWRVEWRIVTSPGNSVTSTGNKKLPHQVPTIDNIDNIQKKGTSGEVLPLNGKKENKTMPNYIPCDEDGNPIRRKKPKAQNQNKDIIKLGFLFQELGEKETGVKPDLTNSYYKLKQAMKNHELSPDDVKELFQFFFKDSKLTPEQHVSLGFCISGSYITQWKVSKKNKPASQIDASADIIL